MDISIIKNIKTPKEISSYLNVSENTVKRWFETKKIPKTYEIDILKFINKDIDYTKYDYKQKDQFYTPTYLAEYCINILKTKLSTLSVDEKKYIYIEPSAGNGSFFNLLPNDRRIGIDIESANDEIIKCDFLKFKPCNNKKYIIIGNPPFGLRGNLALRFINHSYEFADFVAFILPQLFESDGKGNPRNKVKGYNLIHSEKLLSNFYYPDDTEIKINTIFQIWSKNHVDNNYTLKKINNTNLKIYSLSNGGTSSSTRNKNMINKCHAYLPSTCFGKENMKFYNSFEELPNRRGYGIVFNNNINEMIENCKNINWSDISFLSTNSAYNLRTSLIISQFNHD